MTPEQYAKFFNIDTMNNLYSWLGEEPDEYDKEFEWFESKCKVPKLPERVLTNVRIIEDEETKRLP